MKVLVVDDSRSMRRLISMALKHIGETDIAEAEDGVQAIYKLQEALPDLIMLDWNMPNMTGIQFLKRIKGHEKLQHIPVIMVTSEGKSSEIQEALDAGAESYVVKPFKPQDLAQRIRNLRDGKAAG
jgi:two-component system chemotaxis response regulator CheY